MQIKQTASIVQLMSLPVGCLIPLKISFCPQLVKDDIGENLHSFYFTLAKLILCINKHHKSSLEEVSKAKPITYIAQKFYSESREKVNFADP